MEIILFVKIGGGIGGEKKEIFTTINSDKGIGVEKIDKWKK